MRRIDIIWIGIAIFGVGGLVYLALLWLGFEPTAAGVWSQTLLIGFLIAWVLTYLLRVVMHRMTYDQQLKNYQDAVLQKRLESLSPEELAHLQSEIDQDNSSPSIAHTNPEVKS